MSCFGGGVDDDSAGCQTLERQAAQTVGHVLRASRPPPARRPGPDVAIVFGVGELHGSLPSRDGASVRKEGS